MKPPHHPDSSNVWPSWVDTSASVLIVVVLGVVLFFMAEVALTRLDNDTDNEPHTLTQGEPESKFRSDAEHSLKQELALLASQFDDALNIRDKIEAELSELRVLNAQTEKEAQDLRNKLKDTETKHQTLSGQLDIARQETRSTQQTLSLRKIEIDELNTRIAHLSRDAEATGVDPASVQALLTDIRAEYGTALQSMPPLQNELVKVRDTQANLRHRLADADNKIKTALERRDTSRRDIQNLQANVLTLEGETQALAASLANLRSQHAALKLKIEEATTSLLHAQIGLESSKQTQGAQTTSMLAEIKTLQGDVEDIRAETARISQLLQTTEQEAALQRPILTSLKERVNTASTAQVKTLTGYRSEFFGRMSEALGDESDIKIVGDRFVFDSGVLFETGSIFISAAGRRELETFTGTLLNLTDKIPEDTDWVIRIDGHTDTQAIKKSSRFESNWDLSIKRALAVLKTLSKYGVPEHRMIAAGFGEYEPISRGDTPDDFARNRRIEIKLDQR